MTEKRGRSIWRNMLRYSATNLNPMPDNIRAYTPGGTYFSWWTDGNAAAIGDNGIPTFPPRNAAMTRTALETQVLHELRRLPLEQAQEALDFVLFLRSRGGSREPTHEDPLEAVYREMAADTEREREAQEWANALIGDTAHAAG